MCNPASYLCHHRPPPSSPTLWIGCSAHPTLSCRYCLIPRSRTCKLIALSIPTSKNGCTPGVTGNLTTTSTPSGTGTGTKPQHRESHAQKQQQQRPQPQRQKIFCQRCREKWGIEGLYEIEVTWRVGMVDEVLGWLDGGAARGMGFRLSGREIQEGMGRAEEMFMEEGL